MTSLAADLTAVLVHSLWQDTIIAVLIAALLFALRRRRPQLRYLCAAGALALTIAAPVATMLVSGAGRPSIVAQRTNGFGARRAGRLATVVRRTLPATPSATRLAGIEPWAVPIWCAGVLAFSLRLIGSGAHAIRLRRHSEPADAATRLRVLRLAARMGVHHPIDVVRSALSGGPATLGWLRPVILLPPAVLLGLSPGQLDAIIAHEIAHIRRHDYAVNVAQLIVETLCFYHPAVWWISHRMRVERELCCDDAAVEACGDSLEYARALTAMARLSGLTGQLALGAVSTPLLDRVQRLLGLRSAHTSISSWPLVIATLIAIAGVLVSPSGLHAQARSVSPALASVSGTLYDPLGRPADNALIGLGAAERLPGATWRQAKTDANGHFVFNDLSPGRWYFTNPSTDVIAPESVDLHAGNRADLDVHMGVDETAVNIRVCAKCAPEQPYVVPDAVRHAIAADPAGADAGVYTAAEPLEGWDAFNATNWPYPASPRARKLEGNVEIEGSIDADGSTAAIRVTESPGPELADEAMALVKAVRWTPARVRGTPVATRLHVTVEFRVD